MAPRAVAQCTDPPAGPTTADLQDGGSATQLRVSLNPQSLPNGEIVAPSGEKSCSYPDVSGSGDVVIFTTTSADMPGGGSAPPLYHGQLYVRDVPADTLKLVSGVDWTAAGRVNPPTDNVSDQAALSKNGRFVAFTTSADGLPGDDNVDVSDLFLFDRANDLLERSSEVPGSGAAADGASIGMPDVSAQGRFVVFTSTADNLATLVPCPAGVGGSTGPAPRGHLRQVYLLDRKQEDLGLDETPPEPPDIVWISVGKSYYYEQGTGEPSGTWGCVQPQPTGSESAQPTLSDKGCYVAFQSTAKNLAFPPLPEDGTWQVFVWEKDTAQVELVSVSSNGDVADLDCKEPMISGDGRYVAFQTTATLIGLADDNGKQDIYVRDRIDEVTVRVSVTSGGFEWTNAYTGVSKSAVSDSGRFVGFAGRVDPDDPIVSSDPLPRLEAILHDRNADNTGDYDEMDGIDTVYVSRLPGGVAPNGLSGGPMAFSQDGRYMVFPSQASDLDPNDSTGGPEGQDIVRREVWQ